MKSSRSARPTSHEFIPRDVTKWEVPRVPLKTRDDSSYHKAKTDLSRVCIFLLYLFFSPGARLLR